MASKELWIDAPSRFIEYLEDPAATERATDADGMFRTGDLARLAGTGFVYEARIGDAMRLGGFLVSPEEIEAVIQAQPGVAGAQVVAASRGGADPVPVAFVRPAYGVELDEAALRARCLQQLARFKVPERIVVVEGLRPTIRLLFLTGRARRASQTKHARRSQSTTPNYKLVATIPADQAFQPLSESKCPLVKKAQ